VNDVLNFDNISGNASLPMSLVEILGYSTFNGISYSSFSSESICFASSKEISKSKPVEEGYTT